MSYELYYWPGVQGRGEFIRLALEEAGVRYLDIAKLPEKKGGGVPAILRMLEARGLERVPFAVPVLKSGRQLISQTPNILMYLGERLKLAPRDAMGRLWTQQLQLTISDFYLEIFHTHHPLGDGYAYEEQKVAAKRRTRDFLSVRLPKFFDYFERVLTRNHTRSGWLVGARLTYADLSLAQVISGLRYAFPNATRRALRSRPRLRKLHDKVFARPRIARYVGSERRLVFNNEDLFRHYPALDYQ
ncbi:MAG TPA: glutathione S-transferase family protein [Steroidobacteraceae bacterium]|nr:glutathione S-transferase family protein [Steroidobacteraceae bacterium]